MDERLKLMILSLARLHAGVASLKFGFICWAKYIALLFYLFICLFLFYSASLRRNRSCYYVIIVVNAKLQTLRSVLFLRDFAVVDLIFHICTWYMCLNKPLYTHTRSTLYNKMAFWVASPKLTLWYILYARITETRFISLSVDTLWYTPASQSARDILSVYTAQLEIVFSVITNRIVCFFK